MKKKEREKLLKSLKEKIKNPELEERKKKVQMQIGEVFVFKNFFSLSVFRKSAKIFIFCKNLWVHNE